MILILALAIFSLPQTMGQKPTQFHEVESSSVPRSLVMMVTQCEEGDDNDCWEEFMGTGWVLSGDVNQDGVKEFLIHPGRTWRGTGGRMGWLFEKRGGNWVARGAGGWLIPAVRRETSSYFARLKAGKF